MAGRQSECLTIILAAGRGTGLGALTGGRAKALLSFGGSHRLIDFALSSYALSLGGAFGYGGAGVIAQYGRAGVAAYVGEGQVWTQGRAESEIRLLTPGTAAGSQGLYTGDADALWKNMAYIQAYNPRYLFVLSGEQVSQIDGGKMLQAHKASGAAATVATAAASPWRPPAGTKANPHVDVEMSGQINRIDRVAKEASGRRTVMGAYLFTWTALRRYLMWDSVDRHSGTGIWGDVLPGMLRMGEIVATCPYEGYWHDVGSAYGYWKAQMALLPLSKGERWEASRLVSRSEARTVRIRHDQGKGIVVTNALITEGSRIKGIIRSSVISAGAAVEEGAQVIRSVILPGARISKGALVRNAVIGEGAVVGEYALVDGASQVGAQGYDRGVGVYAPALPLQAKAG